MPIILFSPANRRSTHAPDLTAFELPTPELLAAEFVAIGGRSRERDGRSRRPGRWLCTTAGQ